MVSLLLLSRGLRKEGNNEKKRKRKKRNEIQCMILLKSLVFVFIQPKKCFEKGSTKKQVRLMVKDLLTLISNAKKETKEKN